MKRWLFVVLTLCMLCVAGLAAAEETTLLALNVGKADCLLLESGSTRYMIDTGTAESWGTVSAALRTRGITHLDGVILTHTDKDHAGGLWALAMSGVTVDHWYASAYYTDVKASKHPMVLATALREAEVTWLKAGDSLPIDGGTITVLAPMEANDDSENDNSLVLYVETKAGTMLLTGDMEFEEERTLLAAKTLKHADVLKVAHHGRDDATSSSLVRNVTPQVAVISTSTAEREDTPAESVVSLLTSIGAKVAVTQDAGEGVLVTLTDGTASVIMLPEMQLPAEATGVVISDRSNAQDTVSVRNNGEAAVNLSGWFLYSERGKEIFVFPEGTTIAPGQTINIGTMSTPGDTDLLWPDENVWHDKKEDTAYLFDAYGREMDAL